MRESELMNSRPVLTVMKAMEPRTATLLAGLQFLDDYHPLTSDGSFQLGDRVYRISAQLTAEETEGVYKFTAVFTCRSHPEDALPFLKDNGMRAVLKNAFSFQVTQAEVDGEKLFVEMDKAEGSTFVCIAAARG